MVGVRIGRIARRGFCAILALIGGVALVAAPAQADRLKVVCTTTMITDLARVLAGDVADVRGIMKPGEDPHIYEVRPRDVQLIADAQLVLMNGLHLEATLANVIASHARKATVVELAESPLVTPLESEKARGAPDPHCWFNVQYFRVYVERARDALVIADPENADHYRTKATAYLAELATLHNWVTEEIATIPRDRRVMVTSHDAFQYFGRTYFIDVYAVIGISTEQQPKPGDVEALQRIVREKGVRALFVETSVSQTLNDLVRKVAGHSGARIGGTLYSDSLGEPGTEAGTYVGMIRHNVRTIVEALK